MPRTNGQKFAGLVVWLLIVFAAAALGAAASINASAFYADLAQPDWAPPAWVFGPVWTVLYALMGIAAWQIWLAGDAQGSKPALIIFMVQLVLNALWTWLFFGWHLGALAFLDTVVLLGAILATITMFWRISWLAAALLIPYLLWVAFACALNYMVWQLNPQALG